MAPPSHGTSRCPIHGAGPKVQRRELRQRSDKAGQAPCVQRAPQQKQQQQPPLVQPQPLQSQAQLSESTACATPPVPAAAATNTEGSGLRALSAEDKARIGQLIKVLAQERRDKAELKEQLGQQAEKMHDLERERANSKKQETELLSRVARSLDLLRSYQTELHARQSAQSAPVQVESSAAKAESSGSRTSPRLVPDPSPLPQLRQPELVKSQVQDTSCPNCSTVYMADSLFCRHCGQRRVLQLPQEARSERGLSESTASSSCKNDTRRPVNIASDNSGQRSNQTSDSDRHTAGAPVMSVSGSGDEPGVEESTSQPRGAKPDPVARRGPCNADSQLVFSLKPPQLSLLQRYLSIQEDGGGHMARSIAESTGASRERAPRPASSSRERSESSRPHRRDPSVQGEGRQKSVRYAQATQWEPQQAAHEVSKALVAQPRAASQVPSPGSRQVPCRWGSRPRAARRSTAGPAEPPVLRPPPRLRDSEVSLPDPRRYALPVEEVSSGPAVHAGLAAARPLPSEEPPSPQRLRLGSAPPPAPHRPAPQLGTTEMEVQTCPELQQSRPIWPLPDPLHPACSSRSVPQSPNLRRSRSDPRQSYEQMPAEPLLGSPLPAASLPPGRERGGSLHGQSSRRGDSLNFNSLGSWNGSVRLGGYYASDMFEVIDSLESGARPAMQHEAPTPRAGQGCDSAGLAEDLRRLQHELSAIEQRVYPKTGAPASWDARFASDTRRLAQDCREPTGYSTPPRLGGAELRRTRQRDEDACCSICGNVFMADSVFCRRCGHARDTWQARHEPSSSLGFSPSLARRQAWQSAGNDGELSKEIDDVLSLLHMQRVPAD